MAQNRFKHYSVYANGKKEGKIHASKYEGNSGDEPQIGDDGYQGHSDGAATTMLDVDAIIPVAGSDFDWVDALVNKKPIDVAMGTIGGKIHTITMRCTKYAFAGDAKAGTINGSFTLAGGEPSLS